MYTLSPFTCARLKRLPKQAMVWEGDRRSISEGMLDNFGYDGSMEDGHSLANDCILWVDGSEGMVRAVNILPADTGPEAVVRTLLQAMEHPHGSLSPGRPQKIVVCDREIHFFLRGALQDLDIVVDYADTLPIIDDIFESLQQSEDAEVPLLPEGWAAALNEQARRMWENAPWNSLSDDQILSIELNQWGLDNLYVSVLGMAGMEYGLLMYRSLDSLTQFRTLATSENLSSQQMQQAFLSQDCLFLNYELIRDEADPQILPLPWMQSAPSEVVPDFGSLHPLEGLRTALEIEEVASLQVCLAGLNQFFEQHEDQFETSEFPALASEFSIQNPLSQTPLTISVKTCPQVTDQLLRETASASGPNQKGVFRLRDDYVPKGAIVLLTCLPEEKAVIYRALPNYHAIAEVPATQEVMPVVVIQTTRPKAKTLVSHLHSANGIQAVCFNSGQDSMTGDRLQLGLMQTGDGDFHLFIELSEDDPRDQALLEQWHQWRDRSDGICGVVVASGSTGAAKGNPGLRETVALFEAHLKTPEELNLPPLSMHYALDWE